MSEERYIIEMADDGFYSLTDNQTKFIFVEEDKSELERLKDYLIIKDKQLYQLKQQLAEKDKEIEKLKQQYTILENENGKLTTELIMDKYKKAQKEVSFGKQLAIQELEKVKELLLDEYKKYPIVYDKTNDIVAGALDRDKVNEIIDQQIKLLKGEKDVED